MNFKDAYKSYNDEIKGDPKVLEAILNKGKKETAKEGKKLFFIRPSFVGAMAAMVIIAVSVFGFGNLNNPGTSEKTYIAANDINSNKTQPIPDSEFVPDNSNDTVDSISGGNGSEISQDTHIPQEQVGGDISAAQEEGSEIAIPDIPQDARTIPDSENESDTFTTDDCYAYFGFNVTEKAELPQDMDFGSNVIINAEKSPQTGEVEFCRFSIDAFSGTNPQRILDLCVTKQNILSEPTDIQHFVSEETGEVTGGSFSDGNVTVSINSLGLTKEEVTDILTSLK